MEIEKERGIGEKCQGVYIYIYREREREREYDTFQ